MSVKKDSKTQLINLCQEMWYFFTPYDSCEDKDIAEKNLACYDLTVKLTLLSWNTALVKSSLSAVEKTLELINLRAYNGNDLTEDLLNLAAERTWENCRSSLEYFAFAEAVLTDGKAEIRVYRENEANGKGICFEEFRKTMKKDNSGRGIAIFLAERFDAGPEKAELLDFEDEVELPVYFSESSIAEALYDNLTDIFSPKSLDDEDFFRKMVEHLAPKLWNLAETSMRYEDTVDGLPKILSLWNPMTPKHAEVKIVTYFYTVFGVEVLYGHEDLLDDWEHLNNLTMRCIPEEYRSLADNTLEKIRMLGR